MAYYTLKAHEGFLARMEEEGKVGKIPSAEDLRQAETWADAEVDQFIVEVVGAYNAATHITAFRSSAPPAIEALAYLIGSAWIWEKSVIKDGLPKKGQKTQGERLRELAETIKNQIRSSGHVILSDGTLYSLAGKRRRGIVVEDPKVRVYGISDDDTWHDSTSRHNLETLFREANVPAP